MADGPGRQLFATQGLRKTSLDDLVRPVGIAKSTFYLFFDSKEALYLELMVGQAEDVKRRVIDGALHRGDDTRDSLRRFLLATIDVLTTDPLYRRLITHPDEMEAVIAKVGPDTAARLGANDPVAALAEFIARRQADRTLRPVEPDVLVGALQAVLILPAHADQLGAERFPAILQLMVDLVTTGLTTKEPTA